MSSSFYNLLQELKTTNSVKDKEIILTKYKSDELVKNLILYNLNPFFNFYTRKIAKFDASKHILEPTWTAQDRYDCFISLANDLKGRHTTGNLAKETIATVFRMFPQEEYDAYRTVLLKSSIGVGATTVNKVWKDLIPTFDVMLAPNELPDVSKLKYPLESQPKLDGFRAVYIPDKNDIFLGRSGLPIENTNCADVFKALYGVQDYVLDGELYCHGMGFDDIASVLNSEDKPIPEGMKFVVYDCVPLVDWNKKSCKITYDQRLATLRELVQSSIGDRKRITDIISDYVGSAAEAVELYKKYLTNGYEGGMLKNPLGYYKWKRTTVLSGEMLKLKPFKTIDVPITGVYEGEGKFEGTLGGIVVALDSGGSCSVGTGFTDAVRKEIWGNQSKYKGKMVEISYIEETEDNSLRHPSFKRFRPDKD